MRDVKFDLYPWELPLNDIEFEGKVEFEIEMGQQLWQFRNAHNPQISFPYFRVYNATEEHFLFAEFNDRPGTPEDRRVFLRPYWDVIREQISEEDLKRTLQRAFELNAWGRYFLLKADMSRVQNLSEFSEAKWSLFILANGIGRFENIVRRGEATHGIRSWNVMTPFRWHPCPKPRNLRVRTAQSWLDWLDTEVKNPHSTIRFARDLADQSAEEARSRCIRWRNGDYEEWERISRWIIATGGSLWIQNTDDHDIICHILTEGAFPREKSRAKFYTLQGVDRVRLTSEHAEQRLQVMMNYFVPSLDANLIREHFCVEYHQRQLEVLTVSTPVPSAHEQLEAALNLKVWAQDKFSAEEIEILCTIQMG